jgi:acyl-CoA reductase-like NAD-dependent aldehyde dehydrogenase
MDSALPEIMRFDTFQNIIDGQKRSSDKFSRGVDPTTKEKLADVPIASEKDIDEATVAARAAFRSWAQTSFEGRQTLLKKYKSLLSKYEHDLIKCLIMETGKPKFVADIEVRATLEIIDWYIGLKETVLPGYVDEEKEIENQFQKRYLRY